MRALRAVFVAVAFVCVLFAMPGGSYAAVPGTMTYQGRLANNGSGTPVTGSVNIVFKIYNVASGGTALWTEALNNVTVTNGIFTVTLGNTTPITSSIISTADLYIGVTAGVDAEMTPRQKLAIVPFSVRAAEADHAATADSATTAATATTATSVAWSGITSIPASFADGTDADTTYSAGTGLMLTGTTFSVANPLSLSGTNAGGSIITGSNSSTTMNSFGVKGESTALSGFTHGVIGTSSSPNGVGVTGNASTTTGNNKGVYGVSNSSTGYGVYGGNASTGYAGYFNGKTHVQGDLTASGNLTVGGTISGDGSGLTGITAAAAWGSITGMPAGFSDGVDSDTTYTAGAGLMLTGTQFSVANPLSLSGSNAGAGIVTGTNSNSTFNSSGLSGISTDTTGFTYGVYGQSNSTSGVGVMGMTNAGTGTTYGVYASSASTSGLGVLGMATAASGTTIGVYASSNSTNGYGVYATNTGGGYAGYFNGNTFVSGNLTVGGTKSFIQPHINDPAKQINYVATESPEAMVTYRGTAKLVNGEATVILPDYFAIVANGSTVQVQVTPKSADTYGIAVIGETNETINVKEFKNGTGNFEFNYFVTATRAGFEAHEPVEPNSNFRPMANETVSEFEKRFAGSDLGTTAIRNMLISNGILKADGKVDMAVVGKLGWTFAEGDSNSSGATVASSSAK